MNPQTGCTRTAASLSAFCDTGERAIRAPREREGARARERELSCASARLWDSLARVSALFHSALCVKEATRVSAGRRWVESESRSCRMTGLGWDSSSRPFFSLRVCVPEEGGDRAE